MGHKVSTCQSLPSSSLKPSQTNSALLKAVLLIAASSQLDLASSVTSQDTSTIARRNNAPCFVHASHSPSRQNQSRFNTEGGNHHLRPCFQFRQSKHEDSYNDRIIPSEEDARIANVSFSPVRNSDSRVFPANKIQQSPECSNHDDDTSSSSAHIGLSSRLTKGKDENRPHYNDALINRIIKGRNSTNPRWRKRTRRAAASLGINFNNKRYRHEQSYDDSDESQCQQGFRLTSRKSLVDADERNTVSSNVVTKAVPPVSSTIFTSSFDCSTSSLKKNSDRRRLGQRRVCTSFKRRDKPATNEEYQKAKLEWASRYTSLSTLRSTFGTNRNKVWGDFDATTTRKLYHTLLPRALLGLYEMGLWSPADLAPLAYEARVAAKKYARERSAVPGRVFAMVYDGFRSWRDWGTWNVEGLSWEQIWHKYETQVLDEFCFDYDKNDVEQENAFQEEVTALICLRILERSCMSNEAVDKLILEGKFNEKNSRQLRKYKRKRLNRMKAERDIAHIKETLEQDMHDLLQVNNDNGQSLMKNMNFEILKPGGKDNLNGIMNIPGGIALDTI
mmetsp:Transcript_3814/g.5194  ORF Transcript_3814/g.5194 Transcript_3814/m.5194 type:complete len:560 (+) Transcript_3814:148-1827(+)|eukprot:CAMPEP_0184870526 /NCGR_PEP_ID=MMETSP0580-20130426/37796_1 /TAXON_ID=1118495 /ORGANISM="Dactyliosolen fragilissimus" /LENGTH=559 /DNA_ID=CAMNT_0027372643 /DNA_START=75 /DNA_END=1754 /DNA_ORIENTATION=+